jgi:hypothetical protein
MSTVVLPTHILDPIEHYKYMYLDCCIACRYFKICCLLYITRRVDQVQNRYHDNLIKKVNYSRHDVAEKCSPTHPQPITQNWLFRL